MSTNPSPLAGATPEDAVREALVGVFTHFPYTPELMLAAHRLVHALGLPVNADAERIVDALLVRRAPTQKEIAGA